MATKPLTAQAIANFMVGNKNCFPLPIPPFPLGCSVITGVITVCDPADESAVDLVFAGCVIGNLHLDKNQTDGALNDPTGIAVRVEARVVFADKKVEGRFCHRVVSIQHPTGHFECDDWVKIISW
jgi:hypothetical protein